MAPFFFGIGTGKVSEAERSRCDKIARKHDARFSTVHMPDGRRYWFETQSKGAPFDEATANAVMSEVGSVKKVRS